MAGQAAPGEQQEGGRGFQPHTHFGPFTFGGPHPFTFGATTGSSVLTQSGPIQLGIPLFTFQAPGGAPTGVPAPGLMSFFGGQGMASAHIHVGPMGMHVLPTQANSPPGGERPQDAAAATQARV